MEDLRMAFPPKKPYSPNKARPPNSPEPGDKPNHKRTFDMRPKLPTPQMHKRSDNPQHVADPDAEISSASAPETDESTVR